MPIAVVGSVVTVYSFLFEFALWEAPEPDGLTTCNTFAPALVFGGVFVVGLTLLATCGLLSLGAKPVKTWVGFAGAAFLLGVVLVAIGLSQTSGC